MDYFIWDMDPMLFEYGSFKLSWYTLFFFGSFVIGAYVIGRWIFIRENRSLNMLDDYFYISFLGTIIGARLMHCLAYDPYFYLTHPFEILMIQKGGLASHGGMIGLAIGLWIVAKKHNESVLWIFSRSIIASLFLSIFVRLGNFFNSEILGKVTNVPWAVIFIRVDNLPRHPVQLYEAFSWLILCTVFLMLYLKIPPALTTRLFPGLFFFSMFTVRFFTEYTKTKQAAYTWNIPLTTGQMLSIPVIVLGFVWIVWAFKMYKKA